MHIPSRAFAALALAVAWAAPAAAGTIQQTIQFPGIEPRAVYDAYLSSRGHSDMTGFPASWYRPSTKKAVAVGQEGDELQAFGTKGQDGKMKYLLGGKILKLVPGKEIVMSWRPSAWDEQPKSGTDLECILILTLKKNFAGTELQLVQVDIPEYVDADEKNQDGEVSTETAAVNTHWYFRYWAPMQKYFEARKSQGAP
jgi:uncharacterized protein YndB with AHSA1/START domain